MEVKYHTPIEGRTYRIGKRAGINNYLQRCWPHQQHKFLAYMCKKSFEETPDVFTHKELIDEFKLNKGIVSATLKKMVKRNHIEKISDIRPYEYQMTFGGEQYSRYIFTHFPLYHLDIFDYYNHLHLIDYSKHKWIKKDQIMLDNINITGEYDLNINRLNRRLIQLPFELFTEFLELSGKFMLMTIKEREDMFYFRDCSDLKKLSSLLEEEFQIRYVLTIYPGKKQELIDQEREYEKMVIDSLKS